jgi:hypothetical protein
MLTNAIDNWMAEIKQEMLEKGIERSIEKGIEQGIEQGYIYNLIFLNIFIFLILNSHQLIYSYVLRAFWLKLPSL